MIAEEVQNPDQVLSLLMKNDKKDIVISDEDKAKIIKEINAVIGYAQFCYRGKAITVPKITKAKKNINKHIDELLRYLDAGTSFDSDPSVIAFHQAISFSEEDVMYFGQLSCSLIQLKKEFETFYVYKETDEEKLAKETNPNGSGAKYDDFNDVIKCLLNIYKKYHGGFKISGRAPSVELAKGHARVSEDKQITGYAVDFILSVCTPLTFHGRNKNQLKHMIKNCL